MRTWISPWKRITEPRGNRWNLEDLASFIVIGLISRIIGGILRTSLILLGISCLLLAIAGGLAVYVFWVAAPLFIIALLVFGLSFLIS